MRRLSAVALAATLISLILSGTAFADSSGWTRYKDHYVHWTVSMDKPVMGEDSFRTWQTYVTERSAAIKAAKKANDKFEAEREAARKRAAAAAAAAAEAAAQAAQQSSSSQSPAPSGGGSGSCYDMIASAFGSRGLSVSYAYSIALRESNCNPNAQNPIGLQMGHASGIFQIVAPGIWEIYDGKCGFESSSVFSMYANIQVASCMVALYTGWGPWSL